VDLATLWSALDEALLPALRGYRQRLHTISVTEKADRTLVSEADIAIQKLIVEAIRRIFPDSGFIAEEDGGQLPRRGEPMWVIDPIDGTSEFVDPARREYCSVVCRLDAGVVTGAYVLAPELGADKAPVMIHWAGQVTVNGSSALSMAEREIPARASVTRSKGSAPRAYESELARVGCDMKVRTTSQTLDMVRSCIDLTSWTGEPGKQFDIFYRPSQKIWDGVAGIGLVTAMGRLARNDQGTDPLPIRPEFLAQREPTFKATVSGAARCVAWFLGVLGHEGTGGG
jgi:3'(2'), 5'-bisphosphate nucleotidase